MNGYLLGIDTGLTATKAAVYDLHGAELGVCSRPTEAISGRAGESEIDPSNLWLHTAAAVREVVEKTGIDAGQILAAATSGYGNGLCLLDRTGRAPRRAITSMDHRAEEELASLAGEPERQLRELTLQCLWTGQPGILLRWLKQHDEQAYASAGTVLFCKDWIRCCLTGRPATEFTDVSAAGLMNNRTRAYDEAILDLLGIPEVRPCLPEVLPSSAVAGKVTSAAAAATGLKQGTPVVAGLFDVNANPTGSGLVRPGRFCATAGTWSLNVALGREAIVPTRIRQCTIYSDERFYSYIDSSATSASNLQWFMDKLLGGRCSFDDFERVLARYGPGDVEITFLPLLYGGLKNDNPGALFHGLKSFHGADDVLRAIAEGVAFAHNYHLRNLMAEGAAGEAVLFTGGGSRNREWCRIMADVTGLAVEVPDCRQTGALGACVTAAVGVGAYGSFAAAADAMVRIGARYEPDAASGEVYRRKYERFVELLDRVSSGPG